jgi:hypothetical protein
MPGFVFTTPFNVLQPQTSIHPRPTVVRDFHAAGGVIANTVMNAYGPVRDIAPQGVVMANVIGNVGSLRGTVIGNVQGNIEHLSGTVNGNVFGNVQLLTGTIRGSLYGNVGISRGTILGGIRPSLPTGNNRQSQWTWGSSVPPATPGAQPATPGAQPATPGAQPATPGAQPATTSASRPATTSVSQTRPPSVPGTAPPVRHAPNRGAAGSADQRLAAANHEVARLNSLPDSARAYRVLDIQPSASLRDASRARLRILQTLQPRVRMSGMTARLETNRQDGDAEALQAQQRLNAAFDEFKNPSNSNRRT